MSNNHSKVFRKIHYWGSILCVVPVLIILISGLLLLLKKDIEWIQPATIKAPGSGLRLSFEQILEISKSIPQLQVSGWEDINRLDVRPGKGVIKVRASNHWEVQLNPENGQILKVAYRRSDIIEALHDGTFFHDSAKIGVFLPASILLLLLSCTGLFLFSQRIATQRRKKRRLSKLT